MKRFQIFLTPEQIKTLADLSAKTGAPVGELIRRAIDAAYSQMAVKLMEQGSDTEFFQLTENGEEVEQEQLAELRSELKAIGFSTRAISQAFKSIERKDA